MNSDQDGRDAPQLSQLNLQAQALINNQRELTKVKDDLGQATQTIGQLFLEKQQFQQRIRILEEQVDEFQSAKLEAAQPTNSSAVDQDKLLAYAQELRRTRAKLKSSEDEQKRLVEMYERELSGLRQELQAVKEAEAATTEPLPVDPEPPAEEVKEEKEKKKRKKPIKVNIPKRRFSARVGDLFKPGPDAQAPTVYDPKIGEPEPVAPWGNTASEPTAVPQTKPLEWP